jgi:hypothetical protein
MASKIREREAVRASRPEPEMTSSLFLKLSAAVALLCIAAYAWLWYTNEAMPSAWLLRAVFAAMLLTLIAGVANPESRPRLMLRFLAGLFALLTLISFAADISRPSADGGMISLLGHLNSLAPALVTAVERTITGTLGEFGWTMVTALLSLPATVIFLVVALACGFLGRPRRRVRIFANDY